MAFANKIGSLFKQIITSNPSIYRAVRCMSSSKLFVGGISYNTDEQSLTEAFANYGEVVEARIIMDRETGRSRGFGFVTFTSSEEASAAMTGLDGKDLHGRIVKVNHATDRTGGFGGSGGGGYGGGYGGGGGGGYGGGGYGGGGYGGGGYGGGGDGNYSGGYQGSGGGGGGNYSTGGGFGGDSFASSGDTGSAAPGYGAGGDQYNSNLGSSTGGYGDGSREVPLGGDFKDGDLNENIANRG